MTLRSGPAIAIILGCGLTACLAFRPQLPQNLDRVRQRAEHRWQKFGGCENYTLVRCPNGHRLLTMTDGWNYSWVTAYDEHDRLEFEQESSCKGTDTWGHAIACPVETAVVEHDLCQDARRQLEVVGAAVRVDCDGLVRELLVDAGSSLIEVVEGAVLRVDAPSGSEFFEVSFDHAPDGVVVSACERECTPLSSGQLLQARNLRVRRGASKAVDCSWRAQALLRSTRSDAGLSIAK